MKKIILFLISMAAISNACANPCSNMYVDGFFGWNFVNRVEKNDIQIIWDSGYAVGGAFGYRVFKWCRIEAEAAYRTNTFNRLESNDIEVPLDGSLKKISVMGNGLFEIPISDCFLIPYVGGGIGRRWDSIRVTIQPVGAFDTFQEKKNGFAYQGIVGVILCPKKHFQGGLEYRYLSGTDSEGNHAFALNFRGYF